MSEFINAVVDPTVKALITALIGYALYTGLPFVINLFLQSKARFLVKAAESKFAGSGRGEEKRQWVADELQKYARKLLAFVKDDRIRAYLEAAVTELHAELPSALEKAEKQIEAAPEDVQTEAPEQK